MFKLGFVTTIALILTLNSLYAQTSADYVSFQKSFPKVNKAFVDRYDSIRILCEQKNINWPIQQIYLRSFKEDNIIEVWVKDDINTKFKFLKQLKVCGKNGKLGPKRKEGDKQVPEGFYFVDRFNPNSEYHLSLGISYPNVSDKILSDAVRPGGDIYIHGDCVSVGCLAINDIQIEDLYILGTIAKNAGQEYIPIHIFPGKFNQPKSRETINKLAKENEAYVPFISAMQSAFYYFEKERELPAILVDNKGKYVIEDVEIPKETVNSNVNEKSKTVSHKFRNYSKNEVATSVDKMPVYKNDNKEYLKFVKNLNTELSSNLTETQKKAYVTTEFIINTDGTISNVIINKGGNEALNELLITRLENTKDWAPATKDGIPVAYKMVQTFFVE